MLLGAIIEQACSLLPDPQQIAEVLAEEVEVRDPGGLLGGATIRNESFSLEVEGSEESQALWDLLEWRGDSPYLVPAIPNDPEPMPFDWVQLLCRYPAPAEAYVVCVLFERWLEQGEVSVDPLTPREAAQEMYWHIWKNPQLLWEDGPVAYPERRAFALFHREMAQRVRAPQVRRSSKALPTTAKARLQLLEVVAPETTHPKGLRLLALALTELPAHWPLALQDFGPAERALYCALDFKPSPYDTAQDVWDSLRTKMRKVRGIELPPWPVPTIPDQATWLDQDEKHMAWALFAVFGHCTTTTQLSRGSIERDIDAGVPHFIPKSGVEDIAFPRCALGPIGKRALLLLLKWGRGEPSDPVVPQRPGSREPIDQDYMRSLIETHIHQGVPAWPDAGALAQALLHQGQLS